MNSKLQAISLSFSCILIFVHQTIIYFRSLSKCEYEIPKKRDASPWRRGTQMMLEKNNFVQLLHRPTAVATTLVQSFQFFVTFIKSAYYVI